VDNLLVVACVMPSAVRFTTPLRESLVTDLRQLPVTFHPVFSGQIPSIPCYCRTGSAHLPVIISEKPEILDDYPAIPSGAAGCCYVAI
jgi:hypothetical protein